MLIITGFSRGPSAKQPSYLLPQATHIGAPGGGGGGPGGHGRRRSGRREARPRLETGRGDQGELDGGLTSGGGRRERLDSRGQPAAAAGLA
jgi:hypothetical protein